ncbi:MAG: PASTA domain-containing protein [Muribaculaceae bacterium]|nr:PASTA domain-containing protein [Muribaculaceae bacterium]
MKKIFEFFKNHRIIANLFYIIVASLLIMWGALIWLDVWTGHGKTCEVPDVKGMTFDQARTALAEASLEAVLSDSIFTKEAQPGQVVDQVPHAGATVKPDKAVYLTINAFARKAVTMPNFDGMHRRQVVSVLESLGFSNIRVVEVVHEYKDEVVSVKYNGLPISKGMRVPVSASLTIEVGKGYDVDTTTTVSDELVEVE